MSTDRDDFGDVRKGLRMGGASDPEMLAEERRRLAELDGLPPVRRGLGYLRLVGPGFLQSAMTLGGGTAVSALLAGAAFGYELLWVAPVAMLMGVFMLAVVSHQTLSTGLRPFDAMRRHGAAPLAWGWALGALVASIVWHFPQYALASGALQDLVVTGFDAHVDAGLLAWIVLAWAIGLSLLYGRSMRFTRLYERLLKYMIALVVISFGWVVVKTGVDDWGAVFRGFFSFRIPGEREGVQAFTLVVSGLAAAVGINMVFLYPYSLLARGWGRDHRRLARFDLGVGMFLPYVLAASLILIASANTLQADFDGKGIAPVAAAQSLATTIGPTAGRVVFNLGLLGMALSTITLHMLCTGFVCAEVFGFPIGSKKYRLATLLPTPGVLGPILWADYKVWLAVPTSIFCGFLLPVAYIGFLVMQRNRAYLGDDRPRRQGLVLTGMVCVIGFLVFQLGKFAMDRLA